MRPPGHRAEARPLKTECPSLVSDHGGGGTPGPIPNPEVKPPSADGTAEQSVGEQDVADQRGAFACRGPRHPRGGGALLLCGGRMLAKVAVTLESMSGHAASNAVVTCLFLSCCSFGFGCAPAFLAGYLEIERFEGL